MVDCLVKYDDEEIVEEIFVIIGEKFQLENEDEFLFAYLWPTIDFNGVHIEQSWTSIMISYEYYIDQISQAHV